MSAYLLRSQPILVFVVLAATVAAAQQPEQQEQAAQLDTVRRILARAAEKAATIADKHQREAVLGLVAVDLADTGDLEAALATAELVEQLEGRYAVWIAITRQLAKRGEVNNAFQVLERMEDTARRALALVALATGRAWEGDIITALQIAHGIPSTQPSAKSRALAEIGYVQARAGNSVGAGITFDQAEQAAAEEQDAGRRIELLSQLAAFRSSARDRPGTVATAGRVESEAEEIPEGREKEKARVEVAAARARAGGDVEAQGIAGQIEDEGLRATALSRVATAQAWAGKVAAALETVEAIEDKEEKGRALFIIAYTQARANKDIEGALRTAARIESPAMQARTLAFIAVRQARAGEASGAASTMERALATARTLLDEDPERDRSLAEVARAMAEAEDIDGARKLAKSLTSPDYQGNVYEEIARAEAYVRRTKEVPAWVDELDSPANQAHALRGFASGLLLRMKADARKRQLQREQ